MSALKDDDDLRMALRATTSAPSADEPPLDDGVLLAFRAGTLSAEASEALERRLARDPEARALLRELSQEVAAAEVDAVVEKLSPAPLPANVLPFARKKRPVVWGSALVAVAAGLLAVFFAWPARTAVRYVLEVEGGEAETRGSTPTPTQKLVVGDEGRLVLRLRAEQATEAPRALGVFVEAADGRLVRIEGAKVNAARGSFEVQLDGASWLGAVGVHRVWLHVAEDDAAVEKRVGRLQRDTADAGLGWWGFEVERR